MKLRKSVLIGTILTALSLPVIANADLITTDNTDEWSSVDITSVNPPRCSGQAHDDIGITAPGKTNDKATTTDIKSLCGKAPCKANILMEADHDSAKACNGHIIGSAEIDDLNTDIVTNIVITDTRYSVTGGGTNHITIDKVQ